jgi:hypothetical protein
MKGLISSALIRQPKSMLVFAVAAQGRRSDDWFHAVFKTERIGSQLQVCGHYSSTGRQLTSTSSCSLEGLADAAITC